LRVTQRSKERGGWAGQTRAWLRKWGTEAAERTTETPWASRGNAKSTWGALKGKEKNELRLGPKKANSQQGTTQAGQTEFTVGKK